MDKEEREERLREFQELQRHPERLAEWEQNLDPLTKRELDDLRAMR